MGVRDTAVNFFNPIDGQNITGWRAAKLVGTVRGSAGNRQGVNIGFSDKIRCLFGIGEHLLHRQRTLGADTVFLTRLPGLERA